MHTEVLKAYLSFSFRVMRTKVVPEFRDEHGVVRELGCMLIRGKSGFKPIEYSSIEVQQHVGDFSTIVGKVSGWLQKFRRHWVKNSRSLRVSEPPNWSGSLILAWTEGFLELLRLLVSLPKAWARLDSTSLLRVVKTSRKCGWTISWGVPSTFYKGVPTLGQVGSEFQRWHGRMDLASAYVLHRLISLGPAFQSGMGQNHSRRTEIQCILDQRESEGLSEQEDCT